jgi:hypothetical protein
VWDEHLHNAYGRVMHDILGGCFPVNPPQFYQIPFSDHLIDPIKDMLAEAGFSQLKVAVLARDKPVHDLAAFARGLVFGNPVIDQIRSRGGVDPEDIVKTVITALGDHFGRDPTTVSLQAILFEATKR